MTRAGVVETKERRLFQGASGGVKYCWKFEGQRTEKRVLMLVTSR